MAGYTSPELFDLEHSQRSGFEFDFRRVLYRAGRYWYFILLSLIVALLAAYLRNRYTTRIYPVAASIIIKDQQTGSEASLLYNNPLVSGGRNYLNELYILRSYPLIQSVVEDLDFDLIFYLQGNLITSEAYDLVPVKGSVINTDGSGRRDMIFRILDERQFQLET